jgi:hypothetical protein
VTVPLTGTGVELAPAAMELVLDRSGSMAGAAQGGTKMDGLHAAVHLFSDLVVTGRGDEMGSVEFDDLFAPLTPLGAYDDAKRTAIQVDADALTPRNGTSIGGGMETASAALAASPLTRKVMLVFTDGMENEPPSIAMARTLLPAGTEVYAVGLGRPENISMQGLNDAAVTTNNGRFFQTDDTLILRKDFVQVLADAYRLSMAADPIVQLTPGARVEVPVQITACELRVSFVVNWDDPASNVELTVIAPDGTLFDAASPAANQLVRFGRRPRYRYCQIAFPPVDPGSGVPVIGPLQIGTWIMRLQAAGLAGPTERCTTSVMVESDLHIRSRVTAPDLSSPLRFATQVLHQGAPVAGAKVVVTMNAPTRSLAAVSTPAVLAAAARADHHPIPCGGRPRIGTRRQTFRLRPEKQRLYAATLPPPKVDGVYHFEVRATGQACGGTFERYESFSLYIGRQAERRRTTIQLGRANVPNAASIVVVPRDRGGVPLGPSYGSRIRAEMSEGTVWPVIDRLDGSYAVRVSWPPKLGKPKLTLRIDGFVAQVDLERGRSAGPGNNGPEFA